MQMEIIKEENISGEDFFDPLEIPVRNEAKRRKRQVFSSDLKRILCEQVKKYQCIWDNTYASHNNHAEVLQAWCEIAESMDISVMECKSAWKSLKDSRRYHNEVNKKRLEPGSSIDWEFAKDMSFLPNLQDKQTSFSTSLNEANDSSMSTDTENYTHRASQPNHRYTRPQQTQDLSQELMSNISKYLEMQIQNSPQKYGFEKYAYMDSLLKKLPEEKAEDLLFEFLCKIRRNIMLPKKTYSTTSSEFKQDSEMTTSVRLNEIERKLENVTNNQHKILAYLERLTIEDLPKVMYFPVGSVEDMYKVDAASKAEMAKFVDILRKIIQPDGLIANFQKILSETVLIQFNYDGVNKKKSFKELTFLNKALLDACMKEGYNHEDYVKEIRTAFRMYKNRFFKKMYDSRQKQKRDKATDKCADKENDTDNEHETEISGNLEQDKWANMSLDTSLQ